MADRSYGFNVFAAQKGFESVVKGLEKLGRTLDSIDRKTATAQVDVDTAKADAKVGAFARNLQSRIEKAVRSLPDIELNANSSDADRRIAEIRRKLAELSDRRVGIGVDAATAQQEISRLSAELERLGRKSSSVQVRADTGRAAADLQGISALANRIDGQRVSVAVNASDVSRAISMLGLLTGALATASAAVGPAAAGIAALGPLAAAGAQGVGAVAAGLSGIGDAVKALSTEQTKAAAGTAASASSQVNSAQAIIGAQRQVEQAAIQAGRTQITSAQQVADAREALAEAEADTARQIEEAERSRADAQVQATRQVRQAEQSLLQAQQASTDAQLELNRAREQAIERLEDLGLSLRGVAIDEREALLDLQDAQQKLAEGQAQGKTGEELERLQIAADRAQLSLDQTRERFGDLRQENEEYTRSGVEGSHEVAAAQGRVADAAQGVIDAESELTQARTEAARRVADAEADLTRTREDAADREADAQESLTRAQQQAAWAQQDATRSVEDAQRALANAYQDAGNDGASSANKVKEAMSDLSPEAQRFAHFLVDEVLPGLKQIRDRVQASLLPDLETGMRNLSMLGPIVADGLEGAADVIGDLAVKGSEMMASGPWRRDAAAIMASNNRALESFGEIGLDVVDMARNLTASAGPMVERLADAAEQGMELARQWLETKRASGELDEFFDRMGDTILELVHIAGQLIQAGVQISGVMSPLGIEILRLAGNVAEMVGNFAEANPELTQLLGVLALGAAAFVKIGSAVGGLGQVLPVVIGGWSTLVDKIGMFSPRAIESSTAMQRVSSALQNAALNAGTFTEAVIRKASIVENSAEVDARAAAAGERVAQAGSKVANAATKIASTLPVAGAVVAGLAIAYDGLVTNADEAADALLRGGAAAEQATAKLAAQSDWRDKWLGQFAILSDRLVPGIEDATRAMQEQLAAMDPLTRAQTLAAQAQNDYLHAVEQYGPTSIEAINASRDHALASAEQARQQEILKHGLEGTTEAMKVQRDIVLGNLDANIRYEAAVDAVTESVDRNGVSTNISTEAGRANMQALGELAASSATVIERMQQQGASQDEVSAKAAGMRESIYNAAIQIGMTREEARTYVDQLHLVPGQINTTMGLNTGPATEALNRWFNDNANRELRVDIVGDADNILVTGPVRGRAAGGPIYGPGTETSDSILARLSHNEHVWTAREVRGAGGHSRVASLRSAAAAGRLPGFANGGMVQAEDGSWVPASYYATRPANRTPDPARLAYIAAAQRYGLPTSGAAPGQQLRRAEDGSWVRPSFYPSMRNPGETSVKNPADWSAAMQNMPGGKMPADLSKTSKAFGDFGDLLKTKLGPILKDTQTALGTDTKKSLDDLTLATTDDTGSMTRSWNDLHDRLKDRALSMQQAVTGLQFAHNASWSDMRNRAGAEIGTITGPQFTGLHAGMDSVASHASNMASWVGDSYARLRDYTADPIRWSLSQPVNAGLVGAWNRIDAFFALGRPMAPVPIPFSKGGKVPGSGSGDTVPTMLTPGEFVVRKQIAEPTRNFLAALNAGQAEAIQAAGGRFAKMATGGVVGPMQNAARVLQSMHGKPYVWGGEGRSGTDCSGIQAYATRALRMEADPYRRIGTTSDFPWSGFTSGFGRYTIGNVAGSHMRGNLAGVNIESGGAHGYVAYGPPAQGVPYGANYHLPQVGGAFVPGGRSPFDVGAYLQKEFATTRKMISDIRGLYGGGNPPWTMTRLGSDAVDGASNFASKSFDGGGVARGRGWMFKNMIRPERVLDPRTSEAFEQMTRVLNTVRGSAPFVLAPQQRQAAISGAVQAAGPDLAALITALGQQLQAAMPQLEGLRLRIEDDGHNGLARVVNRQNRKLGRQ